MHNTPPEIQDLYNTIRDEKAGEIKQIYHYTSPEGLLNILKSRKLWFSNIHYLNDEQEIEYTYKLLTSYIDDLMTAQHSIPEFYNRIKEYLNQRTEENTKLNYYVCAFSKEPNSLALWTYYTKNENSAGYNINFEKINDLIRNFTSKNPTHNLFYGAVIYEPEKQKEYLKNTVGICKKLYDDNIRDYNYKEKIIEYCKDLINIYSLFFKHKSFANEKEIRVIIKESDDKNSQVKKFFRIKNGLVIPYIELQFNKKTIKSIMISPTQKGPIFKNNIEYFLLLEKYSHVSVKYSDIPLRY